MKRWPAIVAVLCAVGLAIGLVGAIYFGPRTSTPAFELPLACDMPQRCFVEFYVARGGRPADYTCGNRIYDTHRGTDFRVHLPQDFAAGIPVLAAAAGTVVAARDGMEDIDVIELGRDKIAGRAGGNLVALRHGDGWVTQYWHLRRGSVLVKPGDRVAAGQQLGLVGLSGDTNFPHLHFEVRRTDNDNINTGDVIDPFGGTSASSTCQIPPRPLWSAKALAALTYRAIDVVGGFAARNLTRNEAIYGRAVTPPQAGGQLFFWFELFGVDPDDTIVVQFVMPDGTKRAPAEGKVDVPVSYIYRSAGLNPDVELRAGTYGAILTLKRNGAPVFERRFDIEVK
jgi:murein DD-endopeptidase MepM/ murein hydrolase activator NlpD